MLLNMTVWGKGWVSLPPTGWDELAKSLPDKGPVKEKLDAIGDDPLGSFVLLELNDRISKLHLGYQGEYPLRRLEGFSDAELLATQLIESFDSLPWLYTLTIRLPFSLHPALSRQGEFDLSPSIRVVNGQILTRDFPPPNSPSARDSYRLGDAENGWGVDSWFLQVKFDGYAGYDSDACVVTAADEVAAFYGLCFATGLLAPILLPHLMVTDSRHALWFDIHRDSGGEWRPHMGVKVPEQRATLMKCTSTHLRSDAAEQLLFFKAISEIYASSESGRYVLAAKWLFDSYSGSDAMTQFVQAAVCAEVLLGDAVHDGDVSLTKILANRCAYLVASNAAERPDLIKQFVDIYKVRSKIVHTGKSHLSKDERRLFTELQALCARVIMTEHSLLASR